jgi:hypothetical protein
MSTPRAQWEKSAWQLECPCCKAPFLLEKKPADERALLENFCNCITAACQRCQMELAIVAQFKDGRLAPIAISAKQWLESDLPLRRRLASEAARPPRQPTPAWAKNAAIRDRGF